ncbi:MAG: (Fe-S)-binding protein [Candidatus Rokubacteria bacterium]|nr:(Fe-S)-binding protein [Candidatus Rokubacteria bacterium]
MAETVATRYLATPRTAAVEPGPDLAARLQDLRKCVHCGICLPQCPTYLTLGEEMDSPRGRLYLMRAAAEGRIALNDTVARHLDLCLGCRACETACPSGVAYGSLLEAARAALAARRPLRERLLARALFAVFPRPERVGVMLGVLKLYRASGLAALVRRTGILGRFPRLRAMESLVADVPASEPLPEVIAATGKRRGRVGLLTGCVQRHLYPHVNRDTARLLSLAGWEVVVPRDQGCCGALELHAGHLDAFRRRARSLVASFPLDCDFIAVNAAGCGSAMKEYHHWTDEPLVRGFALKTRDITELLVEAELPLGRLDGTVAYHDACHLAHGQRIRREPRELLARIPGLVLVELPESDLCCGSAGVYNLLEPELAERLLERKVQRIVESGARVIAAGNPGCLLQIAKGCRARGVAVEVVHPVELLARAVAQRGADA